MHSKLQIRCLDPARGVLNGIRLRPFEVPATMGIADFHLLPFGGDLCRKPTSPSCSRTRRTGFMERSRETRNVIRAQGSPLGLRVQEHA